MQPTLVWPNDFEGLLTYRGVVLQECSSFCLRSQRPRIKDAISINRELTMTPSLLSDS
jgi:hypothetical protein